MAPKRARSPPARGRRQFPRAKCAKRKSSEAPSASSTKPQPKSLKRKARKAAMKKGLEKKKAPSMEETQSRMEYLESLAERMQDKRPPPLDLSGTLRVGSDCSGMGCDLVALAALGLQSRCVPTFCCEICPKKRELYKDVCSLTGFPLPRLYHDICERDHERLEDIDLYTSGFPCPSFSGIGKKKGVKDRRGHVGFHCLEVAIVKRPVIHVLENVRGLLHKKHERFTNHMKRVLKKCGYKVFMKVLNTKDHGVPQSRPRVYIVCIHSSALRCKFKWPKTSEFDKKNLGRLIQRDVKGDEVLDISAYEKKYGQKVWTGPYVLDVGSSAGWSSAKPAVVPCLTYSRLNVAKPGYYVPSLRRRLNLLEAGRLQGMPDSLMKELIDKHDGKNLGSALGDGMSINVLSKVLLAALIAIGFCPEKDRLDRDDVWRDGWEWQPWNIDG